MITSWFPLIQIQITSYQVQIQDLAWDVQPTAQKTTLRTGIPATRWKASLEPGVRLMLFVQYVYSSSQESLIVILCINHTASILMSD